MSRSFACFIRYCTGSNLDRNLSFSVTASAVATSRSLPFTRKSTWAGSLSTRPESSTVLAPRPAASSSVLSKKARCSSVVRDVSK